MPNYKLKNLTILILAMANLVLALVVLPGRIAEEREQDALRRSLCRLYEQQGVTLLPETIPDTASLYLLELREDSQGDLQAATVLLGEHLLAEDDSTRYLSVYRSAVGQCSVGRSGEFSAVLTGGPEERDIQKGSRRLLKEMGFSHEELTDVQQSDGVCTLAATQTILGVPVLSDGLTLTWTDGQLTALDGIFFTGASSPARVSDRACISAADALVAFLDARFSLGWVGSSVTGIRQGYIRSETAAAAVVRLSPVWRLETETGVFQVNGMTGEVTAVQ